MNKLPKLLCLLVTLTILLSSAAYAFVYETETQSITQRVVRKWLGEWDNRIEITIDQNDVDAPLSDFPILVHLSDSSGRNGDNVTFIFDELQSDANQKKIAVTTSDKVTQCYVEIESWNTAGRQAWLWVKAPNVNDTADTVLYLYYDVNHVDNVDFVGDPNSVPAEHVWENGYKIVSHMADDPDASHIRDSTSNNNDGTKTAAGEPAVTATGYINSAQSFDGSNDQIDTASNESLICAEGTWEFWIKASNDNDLNDSFGGLSYDASNQLGLHFHTGNVLQMYVTNAGSTVDLATTESYADDAWHYIVYTWSGSNAQIYVDYSHEKATATGDYSANFPGNVFARLGEHTDGGSHYYHGIEDEVRVSNIVRSDAWIKASYESERDGLLSFGTEEFAPT
jgi:hypothetical protein